MFNLKDLGKAIKQIADEKGLKPEQIIEAIEISIAAAYKKEYGKRGELVRAKLDLKTGDVRFWQVKTVVDETTVRIVTEGDEEMKDEAPLAEGEVRLPRYNSERHILIEEAKNIKGDAMVGEEVVFPLEPKDDFGRIAAQTAKQVILQKLRESERDSILGEWRDKEGQIVSGLVQRFERGNIYIDLGRTIGVMFANEAIQGEHYRPGERLRFLVLAVQEDARLPGIILSRASPKFVTKLFEMEVPELAEGTCEVKLIAREPGSRTKIAVASKAEGVDPVGAFVGQRGTRVMAVNNELGNEKIDIIEWSEKPEEFIANSLSPAKVRSVEMSPRREALVYVADDQLSLAIGRGGQNVRLAARLTGWKIDVRSQNRPSEAVDGGVAGTKEVAETDAADGPAVTDFGDEESAKVIPKEETKEEKA
jgi:transcription termination/antitermination protein NusA